MERLIQISVLFLGLYLCLGLFLEDLFSDFFPIHNALKNPVFWFGAVLVALSLGVPYYLNRKKRAEDHQPPEEVPAEPDQKTRRRVVGTGTVREISRRDIAEYFLDLYKYQLGALKSAPSEIMLHEERGERPVWVYHFRVRHKDKWHTRRMTLRPIGEEAASRSRVYYAIYDKHIIIKIPPKPILDFGLYIEAIKKEWGVANILAPRECVVPRASVILKFYHSFGRAGQMTEQELEDKYIEWAGKITRFQENLKICGAFVFFMDLSTNFFLGRVLDDLHDAEKRLESELVRNPEVLTDAQHFEGRYGEQDLNACFGIQKVWASCEDGISEVVNKAPTTDSGILFKAPQWFMTHVTGKKPERSETGLSEEDYNTVVSAMERAVWENPDAVKAFTEAVSRHVERVMISQNRPKMEGIVANLLEMLSWLEQKSVALRDLKPDNLLVTGDPAHYPAFLTDPARYRIGIIDVETAVVLKSRGDKPIAQPPLAGTPFYATPSHLFNNRIIEEVFDDLALTLHVQDWHAVLGMAYKTVMNAQLFLRTSRLFPQVLQLMRTPQGRDNPAHFAREASRLFWRGAVEEFSEKMARNRHQLAAVNVPVPDTAADMLLRHLEMVQSNLSRRIEARLKAQTVFSDDRTRNKLLSSSQEIIIRQHRKIEGRAASADKEKQKKEALTVLKDLASLKGREETVARVLAALDDSRPMVALPDLLTALFARVLDAMYDESWGSLFSVREVMPPPAEK